MTLPTTPPVPFGSPAGAGVPWVVERLDAVATAVDAAARAADPITALAPHRMAITELRGVARLDAAPPLGAVLDVVGRLTDATDAPDATGARPPAALVQPTLELAARALREGAAAMLAGLRPATESATVLALAALARAARPPVTTGPAVHPIGSLSGSGATPAPRPAAMARFRAEAVAAAERLREAIARVRAARDPITSDAAAADTMTIATHLGTLAAEYGLTAVSECLETARRGLPALDPRALWVLDEAGVELAEPGTPVEGVLPRFLALRARLDGVQPPPTSGTAWAPVVARLAPASTGPAPAALASFTTPEAPVAAAERATPGAPAGASLANLLRDGIAAFTETVGPILADDGGSAHAATGSATATTVAALPDATELAYRGPSARAAARALRDALERGERAATPAAMDELHDLLRLAEE